MSTDDDCVDGVMDRDASLRLAALDFSIKFNAGQAIPAEVIVGDAGTFYTFLSGGLS